MPNPSVSGPIGGGDKGQAFGANAAADLAQSHYTDAEYFFGGTATSYEKDGAWGLDGIAYSYDIFAQGAQAIAHPKGINPLDGLPIRHVIARRAADQSRIGR